MTVVADAVATRRLLDRFGFGARPGELTAAVAQGFSAILDAMLAAGPDLGVAATPPPTLSSIVDRGQPGTPALKAAQQQRSQDQNTLTRWWLDRMWAAQSSLPERLGTTDPGRQVVTMVYPEFGRRVVANASQGTDHGTANPVFFLGAPVAGGLYGQQPSLTDLDDGDLKASTDFRDLYATSLAAVLGTDPGRVLGPGRTTVPHLLAT